MGRTTTRHYEITPEIKELQKLATVLIPLGYSVNIDITQDLVIINGWRKFTRPQAKDYMLEVISNLSGAKTTADFPDQEKLQREEKAKAKLLKKHREPGAPPELKTLIRRAKRIYKKSFIKLGSTVTAQEKAQNYILTKASELDQGTATQHLMAYIAKELA